MKSLIGMLKDHHEDWVGCKRCPLGERAKHWCTHDILDSKTAHVIRAGRADILFVGIGPGEVENVRGVPFCGPSGAYLRKAIFQSMRVTDKWVIVFGNLVLCRPQDTRHGPNRDPEPEEVQACSPRLQDLIKLCNPRLVISLGRQSQAEVPALLQEMACNARWASLYHPSYVMHQGGMGSPASDRYITAMTETFDWYRMLKEGGYGAQDQAAHVHTG